MIQTLAVGNVDIEAIKDSFPLSDFVGDMVALKKTRGEYKGLCPFHHEKTPSFRIFKDRGGQDRYHCFGCGADGDLFDFADKIRGWTIRETAKQLGMGVVPTYTADRIEELRHKRAAAEAAEAEAKSAIVAESQRRWMAADFDFETHPYLTAKGIKKHVARLENGDTLLIPIYSKTGGIQCVQSIDRACIKKFPKDGTVTGGFCVLGGTVARADGPVYLAEGFATAASIQEATGSVTICCFNGSNMTRVAETLRDRYPHKEYAVCRDLGIAGERAAESAAAVLNCPIHAPDDGPDGYDFNDMAAKHGPGAVRALLIDGELPSGEVLEAASVDVRALAPFDVSSIPVRPWVVPGWLLQRNVAMLIAPPGVGKSTITLQQAISIATAMPWGGWKVERPGNVLLINVEDDLDEMKRRTAAALDTMGIDQSEIAGKLFVHDGDREFLIVRSDERGETVWSPLVKELVETIRKNRIKVLIVDPFAETYSGEENDNGLMKRAATAFREVARLGDCAVMLVHHTSKAASTSVGDMYASRGGSASVGVVRTAATLFQMTVDDAKQFGLPDKDRRLYVRWDDAKGNQSLISGDAKWFRKVGVDIGNATGLSAGDNVGSLVPWTPPDVFETITVQVANQILDKLASGTFKEDRRALRNGDWAGCPIMQIAERSEEQAVAILREWKRNGVIETVKDRDEKTRHERVFVRVNHDRRPS